MEEWRFLDIETTDSAAMNLAIEEAIFIEKTRKPIPPTLRFWRNKNAVVIGYFQKVEAEREKMLRLKERAVRIKIPR